MARRMLIDASHPEETRVVIVSGNRLEEFDYETASKQQIKGNIYLAKITRVEPSLQAAFVDYGGNRHGFLAFNEIHPDYYRIPIADREKLYGDDRDDDGEQPDLIPDGESALSSASSEVRESDTPDDEESTSAEPIDAAGDDAGPDGAETNGSGENRGANVEVMGGDEDDEIDRERRRLRMLRNYRIQEVIKRRQILLVQVTKEERGNKGAALTTYLSLAGRYCVLMPNTARGGGVSRKISNPADRKRLRVILDDLEIPEGMAVIVRTAGSERSRAEIKRDYEYLMRLWDQIRQLTLKSVSPSMTHEEGNLIKRSIRDLYSRDIDEVIVDGESAYRTAKDFMRMLMPSHASRVKRYKEETIPLFQQYSVEGQLDEIHSNTVRLKSGGYLVLSPTEALVSIDVNSGRATRERHIEETALKTNLEAAQEVARQLRLRDLAGLIVIDFIDMDDQRNNNAVERKLKESLRGDRARIQIGRISAFGLLEMSRQRLRPSIIEASSQICPHCNGAGHIRSTESSALQVLRGIEEEGLSGKSAAIEVRTPGPVTLYLLNQKRSAVVAAEERYGFTVAITIDDGLIAPEFKIERTAERSAEQVAETRGVNAAQSARAVSDAATDGDDAIDEPASRDDQEESEGARAEQDEGKTRARRRRPRRRRPRRDDDAASNGTGETVQRDAADGETTSTDSADVLDDEPAATPDLEAGTDDGGEAAPRSRRGRRGGRRRRRRDDASPENDNGSLDAAVQPTPDRAGDPAVDHTVPDDVGQSGGESDVVAATESTAETGGPGPVERDGNDRTNGDAASAQANGRDADEHDPARESRAEPSDEPSKSPPAQTETVDSDAVDAAQRTPPRRGWWQRLIEG